MNNSNNFSISPMSTIDEEVRDEQGTPAQQLFFRQLHAMIMNEASNGCIKWLSDNRGFAISDKESFADKILPRYFGRAKYASFMRRLKRWGFHRVTKGAEVSGAYYHDTFHKDMDFEAYEDMGSSSDIRCLPSDQSLPPNKRMPWSPVPGNMKSPYDSSNAMCRGNAEVCVMPQIMREINRSKRSEREDYHLHAKRAKLEHSAFCNESMASFNSSATNLPYMPDARIGYDSCGFAAFGQSDQDDSKGRIAHQNHLARLKRQVFEQYQGFDCLGHSQSRSARGHSMDFLNPARRDLSQLSAEILKREIALRSFNEENSYARGRQMQGTPCPVNMMPNTSSTTSMNFRSHNNDHDRTNEYCSRVMGALNESAGHMNLASVHQSNWISLNANTSVKDKGHYRFDSMKVPIPGVQEMEPTKNPFNRAA